MIERRNFPTDEIRERLARGWLKLEGTPWGFQGRTPGVALDCAGVLIAGALEVPEVYWADNDVPFYSMKASLGATFYRKFRAIMDEIPPEDVTIGDVLMFWMHRRGIPQHTGGIVDEEFMIHAPFGSASTAGGRKVRAAVQRTRWHSPYWQDRIFCAFRARPASDPTSRHEIESKVTEEIAR